MTIDENCPLKQQRTETIVFEVAAAKNTAEKREKNLIFIQRELYIVTMQNKLTFSWFKEGIINRGDSPKQAPYVTVYWLKDDGGKWSFFGLRGDGDEKRGASQPVQADPPAKIILIKM